MKLAPSLLLLALTGLGVACATASDERREPFSYAPSERSAHPTPQPETLGGPRGDPAADPAQPFDARAAAAQFDHAPACEFAARKLEAQVPDRGWELLKACIKRKDFLDLRLLLAGPWDHDLQTRPDAARVLTNLIAVRGGDPVADVALLHEHNVPLFTLAAAMQEPAVYAGRLVVFRAQVSDMKVAGGKAVATFTEFQHGTNSVYADVGSRQALNVHGRVGGSKFAGKATLGRQERRTEDLDQETGREALGKLSKPDPFLEPNRNFIVLARFDGMRTAPGEEGADPEQLAMLTVLHYVQPTVGAVY